METTEPTQNGTGTGSQTDHQASCKLFFVRMTEHGSIPTKGSVLAAGFDLKSAYDVLVPKRDSALVKTDIQIQLPHGTYGRVAPRSGLALKHKIDVGAGVIDEDYRGNVGVILFNHSDDDFQVNKGDRIAQLICSKIEYPEIVEMKNLDETIRGENGFGSTDAKKPRLENDTDVKSSNDKSEVESNQVDVEGNQVVMDVDAEIQATKSPVKETAAATVSPSKEQLTAATN